MTQSLVVPGQTFVGLFGPPGTGKSTLARIIAKRLGPKSVPLDSGFILGEIVTQKFGAKHWDIDDVRQMLFDKPVPNDGTDPQIMKNDGQEMAGSYDAMFGIVEAFLHAEHPLILTCTLSSQEFGQDRLRAICERYPKACIRIIWCWPEMTLDQFRERFKDRAAAGYVGATTNPDRAWELREKFNPITLPHLKLDTGPAHTVEESAEIALAYILD